MTTAAAVLRAHLVPHLPFPARGVPSRPPCLPFPLAASRTQSSTKFVHSSAIDPIRKLLFIPPGVELGEINEDMVLPGSNIVVGPYAGHSHIKEVEFVGSSGRAKDCPKDGRPEFAVLGRSNVGKSSLINALVRKKEVALTSKKPGSCSSKG
ncbi:hypothetical protein MLD38_005929 [Melastoma candidum]|uniref:Uncharacterized protein n=1 Tax=Melastoma candidum TaxID=119954 RepID=A0ACB9RLC0_9MYRT|nr:hypothetical protein MLD38_005929 [Melastoma candidum]